MNKKIFAAAFTFLAAVGGCTCAVWIDSFFKKTWYETFFSTSFSYNDLLPIELVLLAGVAVFVVIGVFFNSGYKFGSDVFENAACALIFALSCVVSAIFALPEAKESASVFFRIFSYVGVVTDGFAALYFAMKIKYKNKISDAFSISLPLWAMAQISVSYFNPSYTYNSFIRCVFNIALCGALVVCLMEVREKLGTCMLRIRRIAAYITVLLGMTCTGARLSAWPLYIASIAQE
ncbi:MAG: hypothetical protein KBS59_08075, partial [Clostridiales bacterium]|nr:hypothetical protein [Clostridiales bacterium]